ncbi:ABC transporter substrate-binding protein [Streptomyces sp. NPDC004539]|uniref:ABC transporter substrate-binding protein n=1 Tax=Streptomyces sp. NPDC004539 TaxID=3154280 RepID=UPI0033BC023B
MRKRHPHRISRRHALTALGVGALMFASAACDSSPTAASSSSPTLALSIFGTPNSFDPTQLLEGQQMYVWDSVYDTLLIQDEKGRLQPGAALSWQYSTDARTLTLKLRTGMTFSDGSPVDAAAVRATLDRIRTTPGPTQGALASLAAVEAPDASTVVVRLKQPDGSLLTALSQAAGVIGNPKTMATKSAALEPVGSGPYTLDKGQTVNGSVYVLKRRDDYWNKAAYPFATVKVRVISDPTAAANALKAGQTNAGTVDVSQLPSFTGPGYTTKHVDATAGATLVLADRKGQVLKPLADLRVRKAINMAFDRAKMVKQLLRDSGRPSTQIFNPKGTAYDNSLNQTYGYDPQGAKRLLAEAGYPNGFSVTMPSLVFTKTFEPTFTQALGDIGVKVTWQPVPPQQAVSAIASKKYPMFLVVDGLTATPTEARNFYSPTGYRNVFGSTDPRLTALLDQVNRELDPDKAAAIYREINKFGVDNAWYSPVFQIGSDWVTKKGITYVGDGSNTLAVVRQFGTDQ